MLKTLKILQEEGIYIDTLYKTHYLPQQTLLPHFSTTHVIKSRLILQHWNEIKSLKKTNTLSTRKVIHSSHFVPYHGRAIFSQEQQLFSLFPPLSPVITGITFLG